MKNGAEVKIARPTMTQLVIEYRITSKYVLIPQRSNNLKYDVRLHNILNDIMYNTYKNIVNMNMYISTCE